jgi:hypothetical protein
VLDRDNNPLAGVTIRVKGYPELGQTLSRTDGLFDLAVNGGGTLTVEYVRDGYLPAQHQVEAARQDYAWVDDLLLIPLDPVVTTIDLGTGTPTRSPGAAR